MLYFNERFVKQKFQVIFDELECEISQEEINKAIKRSAGPDKMIKVTLLLKINEYFVQYFVK